MAPHFGPLEEVLGQLLETWERRYAFDFDRERRVISFQRGSILATARELDGGLIAVLYEHAPHETTEEICTPEQAAALIEAVLMRKRIDFIRISNTLALW